MPTTARAEWARVGDVDAVRLVGWSDRELATLRTIGPDALDELVRLLPSSVTPSCDVFPSTAAMPGTWTLAGSAITFVPRFPFLAGRSYVALVRASRRDRFELLEVPDRSIERGGATTEVLEIHPTSAEVPRNLLRCYVEFSSPMSEGEAVARVRVVDPATGDEIPGALLETDTELWDPERRRLTVLFDPARIKRGLAPHRALGYPLAEGRPVTLVVDREFRDERGRPMIKEASRTFAVGPDARSKVDPGRWVLDVPSAGGRAPLTATFDRPLDHALVARCITVTGPSHTTLAGAATVGTDDRSWSFTPLASWTGGAHHLVVRAILEDLAGNSVAARVRP